MQRRGLEPNTLIRTSEKGEQPEKALYLLEQMHSRGLDPDTIIPRGCSIASLLAFDRYRTCVYEIEGDGVSHLSCTSDRYNIIIYPMTSPCMCSPLEAMSTGRGLGTFPVVVRQCAAVRMKRASSSALLRSSCFLQKLAFCVGGVHQSHIGLKSTAKAYRRFSWP